jgi:transcriptional regulator with XRE-family HTH domain
VIEDDAYQGVYHGLGVAMNGRAADGAPADRFHLAQILKKTREAQGLTLDEVAEITRVRRTYLEALEQAAYDVLPSRAFAIGHVKAYAKALGLDEETLADMFKVEMAESVRLHAPSGTSLEDVKPNYRLYVTGAMCLVAAIAVWNVLQHNPNLLSSKARGPGNLDDQKWSAGVPLIHDGVVYVTRPAPAPKDQDIPPPYVTPGLEAGFASIAAAGNHDQAAPVPVQDVLQARKSFNPRGAVYGASPENSTVTVQATKSVNLIVRGGDNTVYFAHELGEGEAYRLPANSQQELAVEVSDPTALDMYYNGEYAGALDGPLSTIGRLNQRAAQLSAALDARQAAQGQVSTLYKAPPPAPEKPQLAAHSDAPIPYMPGKALAPAPEHPTPKAAKAAAAAQPPAAAPAPVHPKAEASSSAAPEAPATDTPQ